MTTRHTVPRYLATLKNIDPEKTYGLVEIAKTGAIWWTKDHRTYRKLIQADIAGEGILGAISTGEGKGQRYQIKGSNIIKFIKHYGPGMDLLQSNQHDGKTKRP